MVATSATPNSSGNRPFWIPANVKFDTLPKPLQGAIIEILNPAYQELVRQRVRSGKHLALLRFLESNGQAVASRW